MAVQMTTSSAQDFMSFVPGAETRGVSEKSSGDGGFGEALAAVSKPEPAKHAQRQANARGAGSRSRKITNAQDNPAGDASDQTEETASLMLKAAQASDRLKVLIAQFQQDRPEAGIDELLAQADLAGTKQGRFDPDMILAGFEAELVSGEETDETEETPEGEEALPGNYDAGGESELAMLPLPDTTEAETVEAEAVPAEIDAEVDAGPAKTGGGALAAEQVPDDLPDVRADGEDAPPPEADPRSGEAADAFKAAKDANEKGGAGTAADAEPRTGTGGRTIDELINELTARHREERRQGAESGAPRSPAQGAQKDKKPSANVTAARRQNDVQPAAANSQRDARADAARDASFSSAFAAADSTETAGAQAGARSPSFARAGTAYVLNGEFAFSEGVGTVLEFMRSDGASEARIVVEPPALGHIDVSLRASSAGMEATFRVDNEHLKQMLQQQLDILKSSLQMQGIHVSSIAVDIRNRDDQRGREAAHATGKKSRHAGRTDGVGDGMEESASLVRLDLEGGLLHWIG